MNLLQRLSDIKGLPTLPKIALRIREIIASDTGNASILARIIEQDPSIASNILKVANSTFYSTSGNKITSIKLAITRIGFNEIGHIAMAVSLIKNFSSKSNVLDYKYFWKHSLATGFLTSNIYESVDFSFANRHSLFLAGLFHDIGILVLDQFFHDEFERIIELALKEEISYLEAEKIVIPTENHAVLGSALLEFWNLDLAIISAIRYHHNPEKAPDSFRSIASAAYLAEYILCNSCLGSFEGQISNGNKKALQYLKLTPDNIDSYLRLAEYEVERSDLVLTLESQNSTFQLRAV